MRVSDFDLLIASDRGGPGEGDWTTRWRAKLSTARFAAPPGVAVEERAAWVEAIAREAQGATRPVLFVGHRSGATAIAEAAQSLLGADVRGAFLVAPPDDAALASLSALGWGASPRARLPWPSLVVASRNDRDGAFAEISTLARDWGAELVDAGEAGRIDAASGHGPWPEGLMLLAGFIKRLSAN